jgi:hypothetical protein
MVTLSLAKYSDLVWCLHNDFGRILVFFDDANDAHLFTQIEDFWRHGESRKVQGKDNGSEVLVCVEIEETHNS